MQPLLYALEMKSTVPCPAVLMSQVRRQEYSFPKQDVLLGAVDTSAKTGFHPSRIMQTGGGKSQGPTKINLVFPLWSAAPRPQKLFFHSDNTSVDALLSEKEAHPTNIFCLTHSARFRLQPQSPRPFKALVPGS